MCERKAEQHIVRVRAGACGIEESDVQLARRIVQDGQPVVPPFAAVQCVLPPHLEPAVNVLRGYVDPLFTILTANLRAVDEPRRRRGRRADAMHLNRPAMDARLRPSGGSKSNGRAGRHNHLVHRTSFQLDRIRLLVTKAWFIATSWRDVSSSGTRSPPHTFAT